MTTRPLTYLNYFAIAVLAVLFFACDANADEVEAETNAEATAVYEPEVEMATDYSAEREDFFRELERFYAQESVTPQDVNLVFTELTEASLALASAYNPVEQPEIESKAEALRASYAAIDVASLDTVSTTFATAAEHLSELLKEINSRFYPDLSTEANILHRGAVRIAPELPLLNQTYPINTFFQSAEKVISGMSSPVVEVEADAPN